MFGLSDQLLQNDFFLSLGTPAMRGKYWGKTKLQQAGAEPCQVQLKLGSVVSN